MGRIVHRKDLHASKRRVPASRREMREQAGNHVNPCTTSCNATSCGVFPPPVSAARHCASSMCLYAPYECTVHRLPFQWCSMCDIRARTMCAQMGWDYHGYLQQFYPCMYTPMPSVLYRPPLPSQVPASIMPACATTMPACGTTGSACMSSCTVAASPPFCTVPPNVCLLPSHT